ncbi:hypothetical protein RIF29_13825 [Crotalaria pallida]|uniref:Uncharacterized protein n=1 Tax=Crotalaria pallida TaxID=3830 RepID=A0AAN9IHN8_CROPI
MHVPPFYTYHGPPPTRPACSYHSFRFRPTRSHPVTSRVVREETPPSDPRSSVRVSPSPDPVPSGRKYAIYGLNEVLREEIKNACLVANPGCYPTSIQLPLVPLIKNAVYSVMKHYLSHFVNSAYIFEMFST